MDAVDGEGAEHDVIQRQDDRFGKAHGAALILLAAAAALAPYVTARYGFRAFVVLYVVSVLPWLALRRIAVPLAYVIAIALALRAPLLVAPPLLSGDVYRYLSDGEVVASGGNPYAYTPTDPRINHREIRSIYPPHAQALFAIAHHLTAWRLLIVAFEILAIVLLRRYGLAYATCPLVLFEGTWNGHLDAIAAVFLLLALLYRSGAAVGFAAGLKVIPMAALPALLRQSNRRTRFLLAFLVVLLLPFVPFLGGPIMPGFRDYATRWIFNSPLYDLVSAIVSDAATRIVLAALAVVFILCAKRVSTAIAALLFCTPAVHPWYWLTLVPVALLERSWWIFIALAAPVSYLLYEGASPLFVYGCSAACVALFFSLSSSR